MKKVSHLFRSYWPLVAFVLAVALRLVALGRYVTPDEGAWLFWSLNFRKALLAGDWANTFQTSHPGITTMWLGSLGIQLTLWLRPASAEILQWLEQLIWLTPDYAEPARQLQQFLPITRLVFALVTSIGVVGIGRIVQTDFGRNAALLTTFALALDPFTAGLSGLPMTDTLLAHAALIALLLLNRLHQQSNGKRSSTKHLIFIGICTGLAVLSKLPGVLLLGFVPLVLCAIFWRRWADLLQSTIVWGVAALITIGLLLPATWGAPQHILAVLQSSGGSETSLAIPIFFMGQARFDVGWGFYPVLFVYRMSPVALVGMWVVFGRKKHHPLLLWLLLFSILFIVGLEQSVRVFDRYILPLTMAWTTLGCIALAADAERTIDLRVGRYRLRNVWLFFIATFGLLNAGLPLFAYNTLLGGLPVAQQILPTGWGEVDSIAARRFSTLCPTTSKLFVNNIPATAPFLSHELVKQADVTAHYGGHDWGSFAQLPQQVAATESADFVQTIAGKQVLFHCNGRENPHLALLSPRNLQAQYDAAATLQAATLFAVEGGDGLVVQLRWEGLNSAEFADFNIEIALLDATGQVQSARTIPLVDRNGLPAKHWQAGQPYTLDTLLNVPTPHDGQPYRAIVSLFDNNGARRGVFLGTSQSWDVSTPLGEIKFP
ncbi:MAG: ArnT family glycosyltransferase [Candidatus Promineifilaceae bacterium]